MRSKPNPGGRSPERGGAPGALHRAGRRRPPPARLLAGLVAAVALAAGAAPPAGLATAQAPLDCPEGRNICLEAERQGSFDLKHGTAVLEGNVRGFLREDAVSFTSQTLKAFRNEAGEWVRLVLSGEVTVLQADRRVTARHGVLEQATIVLSGNVRMTEPGTGVTGEEVRLERTSSLATVLGKPGVPLTVLYEPPPQPEPAAAPDEAPESPAEPGALPAPDEVEPAPQPVTAPPPDTTEVRARQAVLDRSAGRAHLTGNVAVRRPAREWALFAQTVELELTEQNELTAFRADGGVRIEQPERQATADAALSRNNNETILLLGNAKVKQPGQFDLASDRIEIYTDAERGVVRSEDQQKPLQLALNLGPTATWRLDGAALEELERQGMPALTLAKLRPLEGRSFGQEKAFQDEVKRLLTPREAERYLEAITAQAKEPPPP